MPLRFRRVQKPRKNGGFPSRLRWRDKSPPKGSRQPRRSVWGCFCLSPIRVKPASTSAGHLFSGLNDRLIFPLNPGGKRQLPYCIAISQLLETTGKIRQLRSGFLNVTRYSPHLRTWQLGSAASNSATAGEVTAQLRTLSVVSPVRRFSDESPSSVTIDLSRNKILSLVS